MPCLAASNCAAGRSFDEIRLGRAHRAPRRAAPGQLRSRRAETPSLPSVQRGRIGIPKDSEHVGAGIEDFLQLGTQFRPGLLFATENLDSSESQPPMFRAVMFPAQPYDIERLAVVRMMTLNVQCSAIAARLTFYLPTPNRLEQFAVCLLSHHKSGVDHFSSWITAPRPRRVLVGSG
jgi:hypothetical protein